MTQAIIAPTTESEETDIVAPRPDVSHIITEDDEPVDNLPSEKQQRLLVEPLYVSSVLPRPFIAAANVGIFYAINQPPVVPDMFLSLGVEVADDWWAQEYRSYFLWEFGKPPDVVVEIVSNRRGGEMSHKFARYAQVGVSYYVIFDPQLLVQSTALRVYELHAGEYRPRPDLRLPRIDLAMTLWEGTYEDKPDRWLRWCDNTGALFPTGAERAEQAQQRAEKERNRAEKQRQRADYEQQRAEQERQRAERLAARLRELGVDPDEQ